MAKNRTAEAILRGCLRLKLIGQPLTRASICAETPVSQATLYRLFPDISVLDEECLFGDAAAAMALPYVNGVKSILSNFDSLTVRLNQLIDFQGAFVLANGAFVYALAHISVKERFHSSPPAQFTAKIIHRLISESKMGTGQRTQHEALSEHLAKLIGYAPMWRIYEDSRLRGLSFKQAAAPLTYEALQIAAAKGPMDTVFDFRPRPNEQTSHS